MSSSRIVSLSQTIAYHTAIIDEHYTTNGLPTPTFDVEMPLEVDLPSSIKRHRQAVLEATEELHSLMLGPLQLVNRLRVCRIHPDLHQAGF